MKERIKVVVCTPDGNVETREIENNLQSLKDLVGGYLEAMSLPSSLRKHGFHGYANEEGLRLGLPPNPYFPGVVGTVVISKADRDGEEIGLTIPEAELVIGLFC